MINQNSLINELSHKARKLAKNKNIDMQKAVWLIVHEHINGFRPVEYDIREIDEALYLSVLNSAKSSSD
tara:strand:+ start:433 stop:639 length:207 start_codon:yes stop_codon:yes gene_type:complete